MTQYCTLDEAFPNQKQKLVKQKKDIGVINTQQENFAQQDPVISSNYGSQKADYDYMCKTAGICIFPNQQQQQQVTSTTTISGLTTKPQTDTGKSNSKIYSSLIAGVPKTVFPMDYTLSDSDKTKFRQALNNTLEHLESWSPSPSPDTSGPIGPTEPISFGPVTSGDFGPAGSNIVYSGANLGSGAGLNGTVPVNYTPRAAFEPTTLDMTSVNGYIDEELESYLMLNDLKPPVSATITSSVPAPVPLDLTSPDLGTVSTNESVPSSIGDNNFNLNLNNFYKKYAVLFDLLLFVITGILIILLLDQLFKLAELSGVNKTLLRLEQVLANNKIIL